MNNPHSAKIILALIFFAFISPRIDAQEYDLITDQEVYWPAPNLSKPGHLQEVTDPIFETKITRVTGDVGTSVQNSSQTWKDIARHGYSSRQPWNADESIIFLDRHKSYSGSWGNSIFLDGQTYEPIQDANIPSGSNDVRWHPTKPDIMLILSNSAVKAWNVRTNTTETLISFSGYSGTTIGGYTGNFSNDGSRVAVQGTRNSDGKTVGFVVDVVLNIKYPDIDFTGIDVDFITISPLGNYVVVNGNFGTGSDRTQIYDLNGNKVGPFWGEYGRPSHFDVAVDQNGDEVVVGGSKSSPDDGRVIKRRMRDGVVTALTSGGYAGHASARSLNRPGWVFVITSTSSSWTPYLGEIIAVKLDGTRVERVCHTRNQWSIYDNQPQPCPSPSGNRVFFASDWNSGGVPIQSYVADFRNLSSSEPPGNVVAEAGEDVAVCQGNSIKLTATGGETFLWNTGQTTASIDVSPNSTTTYTVTVYNADKSLSDSDDVTVAVNQNPDVSAGNDVSITEGESINLVATGADSYRWNTGVTTATINVSPSATTTYSVVGTTNGCDSSDTITVTVNAKAPEPVTADAGDDVSICTGTSTSLTASGGFTYEWSTGSTSAVIDVSPTATTTYTVVAFNESGDASDSDEVVVTVNPIPEVNAGEDVTIDANETVNLVATGADSYRWNTGETTATITVNPAETTTYTVIGSSNGCESSDTISVNVNAPVPEPVTANAGEDATICKGSPTTLTASGGASYIWSTGETTASIEVAPTETTTYSVTVKNEKGDASDIDEVIISVNPLPNVEAGGNVIISLGESTNLNATGADSYEWSDGSTEATISVSPTETTTYTVIGTTLGCENTDSVTVTVTEPEAESVTANAGEDVSICQGSSTTLTASGGETYQWNTGETTATINVSPTQTAVYTVTATNAQGSASDTDDVQVNVNEIPDVFAGEDIEITAGESVSLIATGADSYQWITGETSATISVAPSVTTTYSVAGISNGCENTDEVTVVVKEDAFDVTSLSAGEDVSICKGSSVVLTATGGKSFRWNTGETTASIEVSPNQTTKFTVTLLNEAGEAMANDDVIVKIKELPNINAGADVTINLGQSIRLVASGGNTYSWDSGQTTAAISVSPTETTTYVVTGTMNGCSVSDAIKVSVKDNNGVGNGNGDGNGNGNGNGNGDENGNGHQASAGADIDLCVGSSTTLTASEGDGYLWSTGETSRSITVTPANTTIYTVSVTKGNYTSDDDVKVDVLDNPVVNILNGNEITIIQGEYVTLQATGASRYEWNNGATQPSVAVSPPATTTFFVTGYNNNECYDVKDIKINVVSRVKANVSADAEICLGSSTTLTATGGESYLWSTGETSESITVEPTETTQYSVTVFNEHDSSEAFVSVNVLNCNPSLLDEGSDVREFKVFERSKRGSTIIKIRGFENMTRLAMYDISGRMMFAENLSDHNGSVYTKEISRNFKSESVYLLKLNYGDQVMTKKFILH